MEKLLGVTYDASKHKTHQDWVESRIQTVEADALDQAEGDDQARTRYQRMFWEPVVEGEVCDSKASTSTSLLISSHHQEPDLPNALKRAREDAKGHRVRDDTKANYTALDLPHESGMDVTNSSGAAIGRPTIKFIDVGAKFLDPKDLMRRMKESKRRAKIRRKKAPRRHVVVA